MPAIRVLIADDETLMRGLIRYRLSMEPDFEIVGEAANGRQAVEMAAQLRPDIVIMDLRMPGLNGVQATERIVSQFPHVKVVILTGLPELAQMGKLSGAFDCLDKSCAPDELVATARRAYAARTPVAARPASTNHRESVERLALRAGLTEREKLVVARVVGTELTIREIAANLASELETPMTASAVTHALERALTKLQITPRTRAALVKHVLDVEQRAPA